MWIPGSVDWDTDPASLNWDTPPSDGIGEAWANGNDALFDLGTGIVIIGAPGVEASSISMLSPTTIDGAPLTLVGPARIDIASGVTGTFDAQIAGSGGLQVGTFGPGRVILRAENTFAGTTIVTGNAWLGLESDNALGSTAEGTIVASGSTLALGNIEVGNETITLAGQGNPASYGAIHVNNGLSPTLNGNVTNNGNATIGSAGTLTLRGTTNLGAPGDEMTLSALPGGVILHDGALSGDGALVLSGGGSIALNAANTYLGETSITNGTQVSTGAVNALPTANGRTQLLMDTTGTGGSRLDLSPAGQAVASLTGSSSSSIVLGTDDLLVGNGIGTDTPLIPATAFEGSIEGPGGVTKDGSSIQELSGSNTFEGATTILAGVLRVANPSGLGSTLRGTSVADGATLTVAGVTVTDEALEIAGDGWQPGEGALLGSGAAASYDGPISLTGDAIIRGAADTAFGLGGPIDKTNLNLTIDALGTVNVNGSITGDTVGFDDDMIFSGGGTVNLNAFNSYLGPTSITGGTRVNANVANALPSLHGRTALALDSDGTGGSILDISGSSQSVASLSGAATSRILLGGNSLRIGFGSPANSEGIPAANFPGSIGGVGTLVKDETSTQLLSGPSTFEGLTHVEKGNLTIASDNALGSTATPGSETRVSGEATLALQGGITSGERVIFFNNASLTNNSSTNTLTNLLLVEHDINGPGAGQKAIRIGAREGQLNLTGGIDDHAARFSSNPEMNLALNTGEDDNGTIHIDSVIGSSIRDIRIGRNANTSSTSGTVILGGNNQYGGITYLDGGPVRPGVNSNNSRAFGDSVITVTNENHLLGGSSGSGAQLLNDINLSAGGTLHTEGTLGLGGNIYGAGNLAVTSGTLSLFGNNYYTGSGALSVASGATLRTLNANRISDTSPVEVDGTVSLGGAETIGDLSGGGTITNNGHDLTVNQSSDRSFSGNLTGAGGLSKRGEANLTLADGSDFTGEANIEQGTLTLSGALATNVINVANGATLTTTAADLLSNGATLTNDGTLNLGGNDTITNLFGSETGAINLSGNDLLVLGGVDFQGRINGEGGTVSTGPGDIILGGDNTFTGELTVLNGSTTTLTGSADGNVTIAAGGELTLGSFERIADSATLTILTTDGASPSGILNLNGTERVTTLQSGGVLRGPGLINAETYNLTDGAITEEGADLGNGVLNSDGAVLLGGDSFAGTVNVRSGTMTLHGSLIHEPELTVNVESGATLALGFDERIGDNATANVNGILTLSGTETITTLNINGIGSTLNGTGLLLAETYNLANGATIATGANLGSGVLNSDGSAGVTMNGDSAAEDVNVRSGTLNLNGELTDVTDLTISSGATVNLGGDERVNDPATISLLRNATLNLNGTETVRSFNSNGTLGLSPAATSGTLVITESPIKLMDGHVSLRGTNLENVTGGAPQLTSNGNVLISGTAGDTNPGPQNGTVNVGTLDIQSGTLFLDGLLTNPDGTIDIRAGATLVSGSSHRINGDSSTLNIENGGTWTLGGDETIGVFNSSGSLNGSGTLTAGEYNLSNGATTAVGANLGSGILSSGPGSVTLGGDAAVETATVNSGTLQLNGRLTNVEDLNIADGGSLVSGSPNRINDTASVNITTGGSWTLNGDETVGALNSGGLLNGAGTVTAETYDLTDGAVTESLANLGSGTLNSNGTVILNGNSAAEIANINSGTLTLNGQLTAVTTLNIDNGGTLVNGGAERIHDAATANIVTGGTLTLNGDETIETLNSGGLLNGTGTLTAETYNLTDGAVTETSAHLGTGILNSDGSVVLNGDAAVETANIHTGILRLNGSLTRVSDLNIASGATLANGSDERIHDAAVINNSGTLTLAGVETVAILNADGGLVDGNGLLVAETYNLNNGATTAAGADLGTGTLNSGPGMVTLNGNTSADRINLTTGTLVTNGAVQNPASLITVSANSTWNVNGDFTYDTLTGEGTVIPGGRNGTTFRNANTVSPGNEIGVLTIAGNYLEGGIYQAQLDLAPVSDTLRVTGNVTLDPESRLDLAEFGGLLNGSGAVLCGERWNIIDTPGVIGGGWGEISDINNPGALGRTFQSQLLFDRGTGDLVSLGLLEGQTVSDYLNITPAQVSILTAVLNGATGNDLIVGNFNSQDGGTGTLLNAIYGTGEPGNKDALYDALDTLSPEAFAGIVDYAITATRSYAETALRYRPRMQGGGVILSGGKNGGMPIIREHPGLEPFAGYTHVDVGSSSSLSGNDYQLQSSGAYFGGRWHPNDDVAFSSFIAADTGKVRSSTVGLDVDGVLLGVAIDHSPLGVDSPLRLLGTATHASYRFDGHRQSVAGRYKVPEFDAKAFEVGLRAEYDLLDEEGLRITPVLGIRHISAKTDKVRESGGPGALEIGQQDQSATLMDVGVSASYQEFGSPLGFHAELRWQHNFAEAHRDVEAAFAASASPFEVTSPGMGADAFVFSLGSFYDFNERLRLGLSYRGEARSDADFLHSFNLRFMAGF